MLFIDIQGFEYKSLLSFVLKEIAIYNSETQTYVHRFINPSEEKMAFSINVKRAITYEENNIHGIRWDDKIYPDCNDCEQVKTNKSNEIIEKYKQTSGTLEREEIVAFLQYHISTEYKDIYVKGLKKKQWLMKHISHWNTVVDLDDASCPKLSDLREMFKSHHCNKHSLNNNLNCSLENVYNLLNWYKVITFIKK